MACEIDRDCVFSDQTPDCGRVKQCCAEKLAEKDKQIELVKEMSNVIFTQASALAKDVMEAMKPMLEGEK